MWLFDEDEDSIYIHFRVMDRDEISADDFLGEVKVPFKHIKLNRTLYLELSSTTKTKTKKEELLLTMPQLDSESLDRDKKPYLVIRLHVRGVRAQISLYHSLVTEITYRARTQVHGAATNSSLPPSMDIQRGKLFERIAVFVLGPSAAGKTYMSRLNLPNVLVANHFPIVRSVRARISIISRSLLCDHENYTQITRMSLVSPIYISRKSIEYQHSNTGTFRDDRWRYDERCVRELE